MVTCLLELTDLIYAVWVVGEAHIIVRRAHQHILLKCACLRASAFVWTCACQWVRSVRFCRTSLQVVVSMLSNWFTISWQSPIWAGDNGRNTSAFVTRWDGDSQRRHLSSVRVEYDLATRRWVLASTHIITASNILHNRYRIHTWQQLIRVPAENKSERAAESRAGRGYNPHNAIRLSSRHSHHYHTSE